MPARCRGSKTVPDCGIVDAGTGRHLPGDVTGDGTSVTFYRSYLTAADAAAPVDALFEALRDRGFDVIGPVCALAESAEAGRGWLARQMRGIAPAAIVNATAFSGKGDDGASPLDAANVPVFQVALATSTRDDWAEAERGLSPADLAMHVVLPEVDGRIFAGKSPPSRNPPRATRTCNFRASPIPEPDRIEAIVDRVARAWLRLSQTGKGRQGRGAGAVDLSRANDWQMAHAVGSRRAGLGRGDPGGSGAMPGYAEPRGLHRWRCR